MHPEHFLAERRRVWLYGGVAPVQLLVGLIFWLWPLVLAVGMLYGFNWLRTLRGLQRAGQPRTQAIHHAAYLTLSKIANMQGMLTYYLRRLRGADMQIIEYK